MYESKKLKKFVVDYVTEYVANATNPECGEDPHHVIGCMADIEGDGYYVQPVTFGFYFLVKLYIEAHKRLNVRHICARLIEHLPEYLIEGTERVYNAHDDWAIPSVFMWTPEGEVSCEDGSFVNDCNV